MDQESNRPSTSDFVQAGATPSDPAGERAPAETQQRGQADTRAREAQTARRDPGVNEETRVASPETTGQQRSEAQGAEPSRQDGSGDAGPGLIEASSLQSFRERWTNVQTRFVDEPQGAVRDADTLVAEVIQELAKRFAGEKSKLEGKWSAGSEVSTEDLRQALQQYRSFFERLLSA